MEKIDVDSSARQFVKILRGEIVETFDKEIARTNKVFTEYAKQAMATNSQPLKKGTVEHDLLMDKGVRVQDKLREFQEYIEDRWKEIEDILK